eukprot:s244_g20.t1
MSDRRAKHFPGIAVRLYGAFNTSLARLLCIPGSPILQVASRGSGVAAPGQNFQGSVPRAKGSSARASTDLQAEVCEVVFVHSFSFMGHVIPHGWSLQALGRIAAMT